MKAAYHQGTEKSKKYKVDPMANEARKEEAKDKGFIRQNLDYLEGGSADFQDHIRTAEKSRKERAKRMRQAKKLAMQSVDMLDNYDKSFEEKPYVELIDNEWDKNSTNLDTLVSGNIDVIPKMDDDGNSYPQTNYDKELNETKDDKTSIELGDPYVSDITSQITGEKSKYRVGPEESDRYTTPNKFYGLADVDNKNTTTSVDLQDGNPELQWNPFQWGSD